AGVDRREMRGADGRAAEIAGGEGVELALAEDAAAVEGVEVDPGGAARAHEEVPRKADARHGHAGPAGDRQVEDREREGQAAAPPDHLVEVAVARVVVVLVRT